MMSIVRVIPDRDNWAVTELYVIETKESDMGRFEDTEAAVVDRLRAVWVDAQMTVSLFELELPLNAAGFLQEEMIAVLEALEQDRFIELVPGNRLRLLKALP